MSSQTENKKVLSKKGVKYFYRIHYMCHNIKQKTQKTHKLFVASWGFLNLSAGGYGAKLSGWGSPPYIDSGLLNMASGPCHCQTASLGEFKTQGCGLSCDRLERKFMRSQNRSRREVYPYSYVASYCFHFFFCLPSISLSPSSFLSFNVILCSFLFSDLYFTFYFFFMTFFFIFTGHGQCQLFTS